MEFSLSLSPFDVVIGKIDTAIIWSNVWQLNCHQPDRKSIFICTTTSYNIELCSNTKGSYKSCWITLFSIHISCSSHVNNQSWIYHIFSWSFFSTRKKFSIEIKKDKHANKTLYFTKRIANLQPFKTCPKTKIYFMILWLIFDVEHWYDSFMPGHILLPINLGNFTYKYKVLTWWQ